MLIACWSHSREPQVFAKLQLDLATVQALGVGKTDLSPRKKKKSVHHAPAGAQEEPGPGSSLSERSSLLTASMIDQVVNMNMREVYGHGIRTREKAIKHILQTLPIHMIAPYRPHAVMRTPFSIDGMTNISFTEMRGEIDAFCETQKLAPPSQHAAFATAPQSHHYIKRDEQGKIITYLALSGCILNDTVGSVAVSVDTIASVDEYHSASVAFASLKRSVRKNMRHSIIFAQVAKTPVARKFWRGKLTYTTQAVVAMAMFACFFPDYCIFEDVEDMGLVFE